MNEHVECVPDSPARSHTLTIVNGISLRQAFEFGADFPQFGFGFGFMF